MIKDRNAGVRAETEYDPVDRAMKLVRHYTVGYISEDPHWDDLVAEVAAAIEHAWRAGYETAARRKAPQP
jgi:hypothetical protein